ncbi:hypothetical protein D3C84_734400 [compost metagenome]
MRIKRVLFGCADQHQQQLRHQNQALGRTTGQATEQARYIDAAGAPDAQGFLARQAQGGTGVERGVAAQVLQQDRQRQQRQVMLWFSGFAGLIQFPRYPQQAVGAQAHAFGSPGGAGGESQFGRAGVHRAWAGKRASPELGAFLIAGNEQFGFEFRFGNHSFCLALFQAVGTLCRAEEGGQGHASKAFEQRGQVPEYGLDAVVQSQGDDACLFIAQTLLAVFHFSVQRGVVDFQGVAPQGNDVALALGMAAQGLLESLAFRRHGRLRQGTMASPAG